MSSLTKGVEELIKKLKIKKASGPNDLPVYILKELAEEIAFILKAIYTQSLQNGHTPSRMASLKTSVY